MAEFDALDSLLTTEYAGKVVRKDLLHQIKGGDFPGTIGPALENIKSKYPDRKDLIAILTDETRRNPLTAMPRLVQYCVPQLRVGDAAAVGPPWQCMSSGGSSPAGAAKSAFCGG